MTQDQHAHLLRVLKGFAHRADAKYRAGQAEHGGDLHKKSVHFLLDNSIAEAIDQVVYLLTLKEVLEGPEGV